jgi:hypothetical protein
MEHSGRQAWGGLPVLIEFGLRDELQREHVFSTTIHPELAERKKES